MVQESGSTSGSGATVMPIPAPHPGNPGSSTVRLPSIVEEQRGDQRRPAGLMTGTDAGAVVSVEVFIKRNVIPPVRVALEIVVVAPDCTAPAPSRVAQEDVRQPSS